MVRILYIRRKHTVEDLKYTVLQSPLTRSRGERSSFEIVQGSCIVYIKQIFTTRTTTPRQVKPLLLRCYALITSQFSSRSTGKHHNTEHHNNNNECITKMQQTGELGTWSGCKNATDMIFNSAYAHWKLRSTLKSLFY